MDENKNKNTCSSGNCQGSQKGRSDTLKSFTDDAALKNRMSTIKHKILVLSGKGGVGKSTVAANIAIGLAMEGEKTGLLDADFHGPSIPTLLNLDGQRPESDGKSIRPIEISEGVKVMSMGFLLPNRDDAVIWRGPMKMGVIKQLLTDVEWGELDYLVVDFPPGTGDEPLSAAQLISDVTGAVIVTTPQDLSLNDVRKCINFCRQVKVPVLGIIENMSGLICPNCQQFIEVFKTGGGEKMASEMGVPFLGRIPIDPTIVEASDSGKPFIYHYSNTEAARAFSGAMKPLFALSNDRKEEVSPEPATQSMNKLKIAVPVVEGHLSSHFGHCEEFAIFDVNMEEKNIDKQDRAEAPPHEPGLLPKWLSEKGVGVIIAGGMGSRAQELFAEKGIKVFVGAPAGSPEELVRSYLGGTLTGGSNICDH